MAPCLVDEHFDCYGLDTGVGASHTLLPRRQGVYTPALEIASSSWGLQILHPKQEVGLCSNSCYDTEPM